MNPALNTPSACNVAQLVPSAPGDIWCLSDPPSRTALGERAGVEADWSRRIGAGLEHLALVHDTTDEALWCAFKHPERPCFTPALLTDIADFQCRIEHALRISPLTAGASPPKALVWHSNLADVWNLGGDLELFVRLITSGSRETLRTYAHDCVDTVWRNWTKGGAQIETIALIEGDALGGGFEAALSNDVIIAERHSKFGLPEILFRMFPGMGAYSFLSRRIGGAMAESLITSGRLYSADEMAEMGIVDLVVNTGEGKTAVRQWLSTKSRRRALSSLARVRRRCQPITYEELIDVTDIWVETAFELEPSDLRKMERLARAQDRRRGRDLTRVAA